MFSIQFSNFDNYVLEIGNWLLFGVWYLGIGT
jgi:hypothetical protein